MFSWHAITSPFVAINNIYNIFCFDINSPTPTHLVHVELTRHIPSPLVAIKNINNIFCFDINSPSPKVFIDFIVKISCIVRHINCMASRKLKKRKNFSLASIFEQSHIQGGFVQSSNPIYIKLYTIFDRKNLNWSLTWVLSQSSNCQWQFLMLFLHCQQ